jgi:DNA-binding TFAR19-related protein (PDSD5 family)
LLNNAPQAQQPPQQNQQQQLYAQAQAIAAQILAASAQAKLDVQRPLSVPGNISSVLRGDLMGALARSGSVSNGVTAANGPDPGLLNQIQGEDVICDDVRCCLVS